MQILKTFIDSDGIKHRPGGAVPKSWDKARLTHYQNHGMVGQAPAQPKAPRKPAAPAETKPAAPAETKPAAPSDTAAAAPAEGQTTEAGPAA